MRILTWLCGLWLLPTLLCGQDSLSLLVKDLYSRQPLVGVELRLQPSDSLLARSQAEGLVRLPLLPDSAELLFEHPNFYPKRLAIAKLKKAPQVFLLAQHVGLQNLEIEVVSRAPETQQQVPNQVQVLQAEEIYAQASQTVPAALEKTGAVFVQRSQMGGGSPILRGFEANKILLVVDGVRMNNAIYRSGHLQNAITIDPAMLERVEVHFGPAAVLYGSDALGGAIHFRSKKPRFGRQDKMLSEGAAFVRSQSANAEKTAHLHWNLGWKNTASLTSISFSDFGDLRAGRWKSRPEMDRYWGRYFYADRINGRDSILRNADPLVQRGSAYRQLDILQKIRFRPHPRWELLLNAQYSNSSEVPRYDQLSEGSFDWSGAVPQANSLRFAQWSYGPQYRLFTAFEGVFRPKKQALFDRLRFIAAYQDIHESRITRRFGIPLHNTQLEELDVLTFNLDFSKRGRQGQQLVYGAELRQNWVQSTVQSLNIETRERSNNSLGTRYPDGGSQTRSAAAYLHYRQRLGKKWRLHSGARLNWNQLQAQFLDTALYSLPFQRLSLARLSLTGSAGLSWEYAPTWRLHALLSNAFRMPNVDDMGKIRARGGTVTVPNDDLLPEQALNGELRLSHQQAQRLRLEATAFYTYLFNALVQAPFQLNGEDSLFYDGRNEAIVANVNTGQAQVWGLSARLTWTFRPHWTVESLLAYQRGRDLSAATPLAHIPPLYGRSSLTYQKKRFQAQLLVLYNAAKPLSQYAPASSENLDQALPSGTPGWWVLNAYAQYRLGKWLQVQLGMENVLDKHYRTFSSGISSAGRNLIVSLRTQF